MQRLISKGSIAALSAAAILAGCATPIKNPPAATAPVTQEAAKSAREFTIVAKAAQQELF